MNYGWLPAWRWVFPAFHTNYGLGFSLAPMEMGIAQIAFDFAGLIWFILLWVVKIATSADLLTSAGGSVDRIVHAVAKPIVGDAVLLGFMIVLIATWSCYRALRHGFRHAFRRGISSFIPLAILALMFSASATDNGTGNVVLSPAWIAKEVDTVSNQLGSIVPAGLSSVASTQASNSPSCNTYVAGLTANFESGAKGTYDTTIPETISELWQGSYLYAWGAAQFGDANVGQRISCRYLESQNDVSASTQAGVENAGVAKKGGENPPPPAPSIYGPFAGDPTLTATVTAFAACQYTGGIWSVTPTGQLNKGDGPVAPQDCKDWWTGKYSADSSSFTNGAGFCSGCNGQTQSTINAEGSPNHTKASAFLNAYNGNNAGSGVIYGFFAVISAGAYGVAVGGLALGTFLAQFLLIALLCALPVLLLAMAISDKTGVVARKALTIGARAMVAKVVFLLILGLLAELIVLVNGLVANSGNGIGVVFVAAVAPLLAFYALHVLLRQMGMQGMLSIKGSILTTAGFALGRHERPKDDAPRPGFERMGSRARQRLQDRLPRQLGGRGGGRGPDPSRPGGARPPESGTRSDPGLYPKKQRGAAVEGSAAGGDGIATAAAPGKRRSGPTPGSEAGNGSGPPIPGGNGAAPVTKKSVLVGAVGAGQAATDRVRSRLAAFRAPEAVAQRKTARTRAFHTGLGLLSMAPGRGAMLAAGVAGAVAHAQKAKGFVGERRARLASAASSARSGVRSGSQQIDNRVRASIDAARGAVQHKVGARQERLQERRVARIERRRESWRRFGEEAATAGKFHADLARHRLEKPGRQRTVRAIRTAATSWAGNAQAAFSPRTDAKAAPGRGRHVLNLTSKQSPVAAGGAGRTQKAPKGVSGKAAPAPTKSVAKKSPAKTRAAGRGSSKDPARPRPRGFASDKALSEYKEAHQPEPKQKRRSTPLKPLPPVPPRPSPQGRG